MPEKSSATHRLGPVRNPAIDTAVLRATRELLVERGYAGTSIDAIAKRAGIGRPAIYRRWPSKAHIVHEAIYPRELVVDYPEDPAIPAQIGALVEGAYRLFGEPSTRQGIPGLLMETRANDELHQSLVIDPIETFRAEFTKSLEALAAAGQIREGVDALTLIDAVAGTAIFALSGRDAPDPVALAASLTDLLLHGILPR